MGADEDTGRRTRSYKLRLSPEELKDLHDSAMGQGLDLSTVVRAIPRLLQRYGGSLASDLAEEQRERVLKAAEKL